jgi:hypothetical protein
MFPMTDGLSTNAIYVGERTEFGAQSGKLKFVDLAL